MVWIVLLGRDFVFGVFFAIEIMESSFERVFRSLPLEGDFWFGVFFFERDFLAWRLLFERDYGIVPLRETFGLESSFRKRVL